jgi:hypothetical protein
MELPGPENEQGHDDKEGGDRHQGRNATPF